MRYLITAVFAVFVCSTGLAAESYLSSQASTWQCKPKDLERPRLER